VPTRLIPGPNSAKLQRNNLIIPVTGDLSGTKAMRAIGEYLREINERVSAFYDSNVEFYLVRNGSFDRFVDNLRALPIDERGGLPTDAAVLKVGDTLCVHGDSSCDPRLHST
jgi:hypothetical protein